MRNKAKTSCLKVATVLVLPMLALTLLAQQTNSLSINGQSGEAQVVQVQGRNYVEVEGLARILNGSLRFNGNQIVLSLGGSGAGASGSSQGSSTPSTGLSRGFLNASIEALSEAREWHAALKNAIERGYPLSEEWLAGFRRQAQQALASAKVAVSSDADRDAFPLFASEFNNMGKLSDKYLQMTKNMNYIAPNSLESDPLEQKLVACGHSLVSMVSSGQFADDASCH